MTYSTLVSAIAEVVNNANNGMYANVQYINFVKNDKTEKFSLTAWDSDNEIVAQFSFDKVLTLIDGNIETAEELIFDLCGCDHISGTSEYSKNDYISEIMSYEGVLFEGTTIEDLRELDVDSLEDVANDLDKINKLMEDSAASIICFEDLSNLRNTAIEVEFIGYYDAMKYLMSEDTSLKASIDLANGLGYETDSINSELLASLLATDIVSQEFDGYAVNIKEKF